LRIINIFIGPITEKLDFRHEIKVRPPETLLSLLLLKHEEYTQSQLLPVRVIIFAKQSRVLLVNAP